MSMYINIRKEMDFSDFERECWSGAEFTLARIAEEGKEEEFLNWLLEHFEGGLFEELPTLTEINDLLRFDSDWVLEQLGIDKVKKYDLADLDGNSYYNALENYVREFALYDEKGEKFKAEIFDKFGCAATNWDATTIQTIEEAIAANGVQFDENGELLEDI